MADATRLDAERARGNVTATPVGCACGDGVVDWGLDRHITRSVECGTIEQEERSLGSCRSC